MHNIIKLFTGGMQYLMTFWLQLPLRMIYFYVCVNLVVNLCVWFSFLYVHIVIVLLCWYMWLHVFCFFLYVCMYAVWKNDIADWFELKIKIKSKCIIIVAPFLVQHVRYCLSIYDVCICPSNEKFILSLMVFVTDTSIAGGTDRCWITHLQNALFIALLFSGLLIVTLNTWALSWAGSTASVW